MVTGTYWGPDNSSRYPTSDSRHDAGTGPGVRTLRGVHERDFKSGSWKREKREVGTNLKVLLNGDQNQEHSKEGMSNGGICPIARLQVGNDMNLRET